MSDKTKCPKCGGPCNELYGYDPMENIRKYVYHSTAPAEIARAQRAAVKKALYQFGILYNKNFNAEEWIEVNYPAPGGETDENDK